MPVAFENLIGSITLKGGGNPGRVKVEAQVIAEGETAEQAQALADSIRLDRTNADGGAVIHVAYPVNDYTAFKMPREETDESRGPTVAVGVGERRR